MRKIPCGVAALFAYPWYNNPASYRGYHNYGQKPKCMIFPAICNFRVELHQKIQSKSVTIFHINEVSKLHPLAITNTHTHTPIKVTTFKFYFFYRKELLKGFFRQDSRVSLSLYENYSMGIPWET